MDSFENSPDTTQVVNDQTEVTLTPEPTSNPVPVSTTPPADTTPKATSKKNYLEIGILLVIIAILAGLVTWYFVSKNQPISEPQESDTTDQANGGTTTQPTVVVVTPTMEPRELKVMANCMVSSINPDKTLAEAERNEEICIYGDKIFKDNKEYAYLYNRDDYSADTVLFDIEGEKSISYPKDLHFYDNNSSSGSIYSLASYPMRVIYKGTLSNLKQQKLFEYDPTGFGRGGMVEDDVEIIPNSDESRIIFQDTTSPAFLTGYDPDDLASVDNAMGGMLVLSQQGTRILDVPHAYQTRWIDDSSLITLVTNGTRSQVVLRKYNFSQEGTYTFTDLYKIADKSTFGDIYDIDIYNNMAALSVLSKGDYLLYMADLTGDTTNLIKYENAPARAVILDSDYILGYGLTPCDPSLEVGSEGNFCTPADGSFSDYKSDVRLYNIKTKKTTTLLELDEMYLL